MSSLTAALAAVTLAMSTSAFAQSTVQFPPMSNVPGTVTPATTQPQPPTAAATPPTTPPTEAPSAAPAVRTLTVPIAGSAGNGSTLAGMLRLTSFAVENGQLVATGAVTGTLSSASGTGTSIISNVALPVAMGQTSCSAVSATLGPSAVGLGGTTVNVGQVVLNLTSQAGGGDVLGSLMCGVPGVVGNATSLATVLNQILAAM